MIVEEMSLYLAKCVNLGSMKVSFVSRHCAVPLHSQCVNILSPHSLDGMLATLATVRSAILSLFPTFPLAW